MFRFVLAACLVNHAAYAAETTSQIARRDLVVRGERGIRLAVREVVSKQAKDPAPILLLHGIRVPGVPSFDLPVPGGSLATDLAARGLAVYIMDLRGYGGSTRPPEMTEPPENHPPAVRSNQAARDIAAVVDWIAERRHTPKVALLGWATGGQWMGYYASVYPEKVSHLIVLNSLYGGSDVHAMLGHGTDMEDPQHPGRFRTDVGAYRWSTAESLFTVWDRSIPAEDKTAWRDPAVAKAYAEAALASDPAGRSRHPPAFRSPNGGFEDSFYLAIGRKLWDASLITAPTLILASERDFWSRPEDRKLLEQELTRAPRVKVVVIPGATHFVHLDRQER